MSMALASSLRATEGPRFYEWIPEEWRNLFRSSAAMVTIPRRRLLRSGISAKHGWVNICGAPGQGRSTLLRQIDDALSGLHRPHIMITDSANENRSISQILSDLHGEYGSGRRNAEKLERADSRDAELAEAETQEYGALLIDDFDYWLENGHAEELRDIFRQSPSLTVIAVTLNPLDPDMWGDDASSFVPVRGSELAFTLDEVTLLSQAIVEASPGLPALNERENEQLKTLTGGFPLAVGLAFDHWYSPESSRLEGFNVELALLAIRRAFATRYPHLADLGTTRIARLLSFMPRFDECHVRMVAKAFSDSSNYSVFDDSPVIGLSDSSGSGATGYAWKDSAWRVFLDWNESSRDVRRNLIHALLDMEDYARAFDQMILLRDFAAAEQLLARHFKGIYEGFAPEIQEMLLSVAPEQLDRAPCLRLVQALLKLGIGDDSASRRPGALGRAAEVVSSGRHSRQALVASAAIALRLGKTRDAYNRAERVLAGAAGVDDIFQAAQLMLRCGALPGTPLRSLAEGRVMSVNEALTETLISKIAGGGGVFTAHKSVMRFRSLICSDEWLDQEIAKWDLLDEIFSTQDADVPTMQEQFGESPIYLRLLFSCARLLAVGNLPMAIDVSDSGFAPDPARGIAQAIVQLAAGQIHQLRDTLSAITSDGGQRTDAILAALRAASFNRQGLNGESQPLLDTLSNMQLPLVAFALSLLPPTDLAMLLDLQPGLAGAAAIAAQRGIVGLGAVLPNHFEFVELTKREMEILHLLQQGLSDREISNICYISLNTTKTHMHAIRKKLAVGKRRDIVARAQELHLL